MQIGYLFIYIINTPIRKSETERINNKRALFTIILFSLLFLTASIKQGNIFKIFKALKAIKGNEKSIIKYPIP